MIERPKVPCSRCGILRTVKPERRTMLCADCRSVLTSEERKAWAA